MACMRDITYREYRELPAPREVVIETLCDTKTWEVLPTGLEHIGEFWKWGDELYTLTCADETHTPDSCVLRWTLTPATLIGVRASIKLTLYDAHVSTHVLVDIALMQGSEVQDTGLALSRQTLTSLVDVCHKKLTAIVVARSTTPVAQAMAMHMASPPHASPQMSHETATTVGTYTEGEQRTTGGAADVAVAESRQDGQVPNQAQAQALIDRLRDRYPITVAAFEEMGALDHLEHVWQLEQRWQRIMAGEYDSSVYQIYSGSPPASSSASSPRQGATNGVFSTPSLDFDLIYAGAGLGLLHAAVMAHCYGWRVMVFDRAEVGSAHREWNISRGELEALVTIGLVTWDELEPVIMREYRTGLVDFYTGPYGDIAHNSLWLPDVLSLAIDANGLLALMRRKLEAAGSTILDYRLFSRVLVPATGATHVTVELIPTGNQQDGQREQYTAQLLMDGMGTTSSLGLVRHRGTPFAGICPTVGTAVRGFVQGSGPREVDPTIGDILISVADTQGNRQFIWEGFPGREDEMAVYVFYYAALSGKQHYRPDEQPPISLLELFENYFSLLPTYKQPGPTFAHLKPLYGYIPGRHSLSPQEAPLLRGVVPIGDAAAQQSPLTYCGFGSHVRNLHRTTSLLDYALRRGLLEPEHLGHINAFQNNVSLNWVFSYFMQPWGRPHNVNELQNVFLRALNELGTPLSARFFQDQMRWSDYNSVIWTVLMNYPIIIAKAWHVLGMTGIYQWARDYTRFTMETFLATIARTAGHGVERASLRLFDRIAPAVSLRIRGKYAEWRAMRWVAPTSSPRADERLAQSAPSHPGRTS